MPTTPRVRVATTAAASLVALVLAHPTAHASTGEPAPAAATDPYVVVAEPGASDDVARTLAEVGATPDLEFDELVDGFAVELTPEQVAAVAAAPSVGTLEPDQVFTTTGTQSPAPWGLDRIDQTSLPLDKAFTYPASAGTDVVVYVVDSGISPHPQLGSRLAEGFTTIEDGGGTADCHGHGTHVAGTVASTSYGVAKSATVVPVRVLRCDGRGVSSDVVRGLEWIAQAHPALSPGVVNLSIGGPRDTAVNSAVAALVARGLTVVAAAGNDAVDACSTSPASAPAAVTVGASTRDDARASFSNWGPCLDVFAPGELIESTSRTSGSALASGTSMAAPHASGVAALVLGADPSASPGAVTAAIMTAATQPVADAGVGTTARLLSARVAGPSASTRTQRYVAQVYQHLFGRAPDAGGLAGWSAALDAGTARGAVADSITSSPEYRGRLIRESYRTYLGRDPDPSGARGWLAAMGSGITIQQMEVGFVASPEHYQRAGGTDAGWVRTLYGDVFGREPAAAEVDAWTAALAAGASRGQVAGGFLLSTEHLSMAVDLHYRHLLGRQIDPTGRSGWVTAIQRGTRIEAVIAGIVASEEYYGRATA